MARKNVTRKQKPVRLFTVHKHGSFYRIIEDFGPNWPPRSVLVIKGKAKANKIARFLNQELPQGSA